MSEHCSCGMEPIGPPSLHFPHLCHWYSIQAPKWQWSSLQIARVDEVLISFKQKKMPHMFRNYHNGQHEGRQIFEVNKYFFSAARLWLPSLFPLWVSLELSTGPGLLYIPGLRTWFPEGSHVHCCILSTVHCCAPRFSWPDRHPHLASFC